MSGWSQPLWGQAHCPLQGPSAAAAQVIRGCMMLGGSRDAEGGLFLPRFDLSSERLTACRANGRPLAFCQLACQC
jgi:hypothetical protein